MPVVVTLNIDGGEITSKWQIHKLLLQPDISHIGHPHLISKAEEVVNLRGRAFRARLLQFPNS